MSLRTIGMTKMAARTAQKRQSGPRVLVVDDEPEIVDLTRVYLEREGFDVVGATDPETALSRFEQERVDCVVSDYRLGGTTGVAFCERVRQRSAVPCIVFTSGDGSEVREAVAEAGLGLVYKRGTEGYDELARRIRERTTQQAA